MSNFFYKRNLPVPYFTQRDNTYIWQQLAEKDEYDKNNKKQNKKKNHLVRNTLCHGVHVILQACV